MELETPIAQEVPAVEPNAYPELGDRYKSILVDTIVIVAMMFGAGYLFDVWTTAPESARMWAFLFIWAGYEPLATAFGCTLGQYVMKIRVRQANNEARCIDLLQAYGRYATKLLLGWLIFLTMGTNPRRRGIRDLVAGSVMVRVKPNKWMGPYSLQAYPQ